MTGYFVHMQSTCEGILYEESYLVQRTIITSKNIEYLIGPNIDPITYNLRRILTATETWQDDWADKCLL